MRRSAVVSLLLLGTSCLAVTPVWKTPVSERRFAPPLLKRSSAPYYTRPEDFQIPSYQPPRPNNTPALPPPQLARLPITPPGFRPNYNLYPRPQQPQSGPFPPPQYPQRPYYPQAYQPRPPPQQNGRFSNGWIYWNGAIVPPEAVPYLQGVGPIPPQGAYGPAPSTRPAATIPAVRPDTFTGKIPMAPSAQPELYNTPPTTVPGQPYGNEVTVVTVPKAVEMTTLHDETTTTTTTTEGTTTTKIQETTKTQAATTSRTTSAEEESTIGALFTMKKNPFEAATTLARTAETTTKEEHEGGYEFGTVPTRGPPSAPAATPPQPTVPANVPARQPEIDYFPRPVVSQAYQPPKPSEKSPGQEVIEKLDVKVLQPSPCAGPLCFDKNKVSVYTPPKGPKLLISNAAKGEQAYLPRPSVPEQKYLPYAPSLGVPPRPLEHPRGPHVFIPPNAFPVPPTGYEVTPPPQAPPTPFSATARTLPPPTASYVATPPSAQPPLPPAITPPQPDIIPVVPSYGGFVPQETPPPVLTPPPYTPGLLYPPTEVPPSPEYTEETGYLPFVPVISPSTPPPWATPTTEVVPSSFSPTYKPLHPETVPERPTPPYVTETTPPTAPPTRPPHPTLIPGSEAPPTSPPSQESIPPERETTPRLPETPPPTVAPPTPPVQPPRTPPTFPGQPPQTPPTLPVQPPQTPPTFPVQTPPTPPVQPPQTPPTLPVQPPQTPPTFPVQTPPTPPVQPPQTPPTPPVQPPRTPPTRPPERPTLPPSFIPGQPVTVPPEQTPPTPATVPQASPPVQPFPPQTPPHPTSLQTTPPRTVPPQTPPPRTPPPQTPPPETQPPRTPPPQTPPPETSPQPTPPRTTPSPGPTTTPYFVNKTTPTFYQPTATPKKGVQNRLRTGKVRVICQEEGIKFVATSIIPFSGEIFANEHKRIPACYHSYENVVMPMAFLPFNECGVKNAGDQANNQTQYHMQVVVVIKQEDGSTTVQSYMAQCVHQKIHYDKQSLPRRIEEALEELRLVPTKLEQKALLPLVEMKLLVDEHGRLGPEVAAVDIGMPLALQWKLTNESSAYGFHVKNCAVADMVTGMDMTVVDEQGCSTDTTILGHPHYDTYHDSAASHMWAFKVPDNTRLRLSCEVSICTDIAPDGSNQTSCNNIPTPPFCPDLITSPANSILFDAGGNFLKRRRETDGLEETQTVRAAICTSANCRRDYVALPHCVDTRWLAASSAFSISLLALSVLVNLGLRWKVAHEKELVQSGRY